MRQSVEDRDGEDVVVKIFGIAAPTYPSFRAAFGVPDDFTPIGAISFGYSNETAPTCRLGRDPPRPLSLAPMSRLTMRPTLSPRLPSVGAEVLDRPGEWAPTVDGPGRHSLIRLVRCTARVPIKTPARSEH
jgi:hypothetical protein